MKHTGSGRDSKSKKITSNPMPMKSPIADKKTKRMTPFEVLEMFLSVEFLNTIVIEQR